LQNTHAGHVLAIVSGVHNGIPAPSRAREIETEQSKLSGGGNELLPDTRAQALAGRIDPQVEAVGELDRAENGGG
jgi:hypothetical protein